TLRAARHDQLVRTWCRCRYRRPGASSGLRLQWPFRCGGDLCAGAVWNVRPAISRAEACGRPRREVRPPSVCVLMRFGLAPLCSGTELAARRPMPASGSSAARVLSRQSEIEAWQEDLYRTLHRHPELSNHEVRTAAAAAGALREAGCEVHEK